jgi:hypothetical protein
MGDQPVVRPLPNTNTKRKQTSMPSVGWEPTVPVFERAKIFHASERTATMIGAVTLLTAICRTLTSSGAHSGPSIGLSASGGEIIPPPPPPKVNTNMNGCADLNRILRTAVHRSIVFGDMANWGRY